MVSESLSSAPSGVRAATGISSSSEGSKSSSVAGATLVGDTGGASSSHANPLPAIVLCVRGCRGVIADIAGGSEGREIAELVVGGKVIADLAGGMRGQRLQI